MPKGIKILSSKDEDNYKKAARENNITYLILKVYTITDARIARFLAKEIILFEDNKKKKEE